MRPRYLLPIVSVLTLAGSIPAPVGADTIHFKNKTVLDGVKIVEEDWHGVQARVSDGVVVSFSRRDIEKIEREWQRQNAVDRVSSTSTERLIRLVVRDYREGERTRLRGLELWTTTKPNGTSEPASAPQLIATVRAQRRGDSVTFSLDMRGTDGAKYAPAALRVNGKRLPPPGFEVRDAQGGLVHRGAFKYG